MKSDVEKKLRDMIWNISWGIHDEEKEKESHIEEVREIFDYANEHGLLDNIGFLRLNVNDFRIINKEYPGVLKNALVSIFMTSINEISISELDDLLANYNIQYFMIADLHRFEENRRMGLQLVYKYKKAVMKFAETIDDESLIDNPNREKFIFGKLVEEIAGRIEYDEKIQEKVIDRNYEEYRINHESPFNNPSNEMIGLLEGRCVCRGIAGIVRDVCSELNIDVKVIAGVPDDGSGNGHAWNQVKLDDVWYNVDVTWDTKYLIGRGESYWMFKSDSDFMNSLTVTNNNGQVILEEDHKLYSNRLTSSVPCNVTIPKEEINKYIDINKIRSKQWLKNFVKSEKEILPLKQIGVS